MTHSSPSPPLSSDRPPVPLCALLGSSSILLLNYMPRALNWNFKWILCASRFAERRECFQFFFSSIPRFSFLFCFLCSDDCWPATISWWYTTLHTRHRRTDKTKKWIKQKSGERNVSWICSLQSGRIECDACYLSREPAQTTQGKMN